MSGSCAAVGSADKDRERDRIEAVPKSEIGPRFPANATKQKIWRSTAAGDWDEAESLDGFSIDLS
jgi:hypothetical protein